MMMLMRNIMIQTNQYLSDCSVINESGMRCDNNLKYRPRPVKLKKHTSTSNHCSNITDTALITQVWHVEKYSALGLGLIELLCSQQLSIIGGQCQCQSKAPTAPHWSKPSLQMSLRCQLKSFSWNWDERRSCDGSLTATKLVWRPERESECVKEWKSERVKESNK